ncbi:MAG: PilT/PilU family type 4a pilus ATPase [Planctomycetaceae bacterium]|jgi:twitching motility protein PilT|nr:PilT/PilU family type 4a pilus ATPase [Planctomycetaceae bacterium]
MQSESQRLLLELVERNGSDLHLAEGNRPVMRIHGVLYPLEHYQPLVAEQTQTLIKDIVGETSFKRLLAAGELDVAIEFPGDGNSRPWRLRINGYRQQGTYAAAIRLLPNKFFSFKELGLPMQVLEKICRLNNGLVLVTGATSSGKSTTIASIVNEINKERPCHILTIEDPVEYRHYSQKAFVTQREVGVDTASFAEALRRAMREDPDVIVVGEMRDLETISAALTLAETGHLTFATLHSSTAVQTISRVISAYPAVQQSQVRIQLASTLRFAICQNLTPWDNNQGRSLIAEILVVNSAVRAMIREEKTHQLKNIMQTNYDIGMRTLEQATETILKQNHISRKQAKLYLNLEE